MGRAIESIIASQEALAGEMYALRQDASVSVLDDEGTSFNTLSLTPTLTLIG